MLNMERTALALIEYEDAERKLKKAMDGGYDSDVLIAALAQSEHAEKALGEAFYADTMDRNGPESVAIVNSGHGMKVLRILVAKWRKQSFIDESIDELPVEDNEYTSSFRVESAKSRVGEPWSKDEELSMVRDYQNRTSVEALAVKHKRSVTGIECRLKRLGLIF